MDQSVISSHKEARRLSCARFFKDFSSISQFLSYFPLHRFSSFSTDIPDGVLRVPGFGGNQSVKNKTSVCTELW